MMIGRLPAYPSTQARRQLPPSQLASLNKIIASTLAQTISLPPTKRDAESCRIFVQTYARDASLQALHTLIWGSQDDNKQTSDEGMICQYTLKLAESISSSLDLQILLDLAIGYSQIQGHKSRLKAVFTAISEPGMPVHDTIVKDLVPSFTLLLSPQSLSNQSQGLYAVRKTAHCILSFLRASPPTFIRHFAHSKDFILSLAYAYETSLASIATSYGGINVLQNAINRSSDVEADEWEKVWVDTKVALIDSFHIVLGQLLEDMSVAKGRTLGSEAERTFDIVFSLLEQCNSSTSSPTTNSIPPIPFLNRSLLADYQQSYSLSRTLASILKNVEEKDARLDIIESTLVAFDSQSNQGKDPGALKLVLHSYGLQRGLVNRGTRSKRRVPPSTGATPSTNDAPLPPINTATSYDKGKGKAKAPARIEDPELDVKVTQILDVLPDLNPVYVRQLLGNEIYKGDPEQVLSALLEGHAPTEEEMNLELEQQEFHRHLPMSSGDYDVTQRRNVFDDQELDLAQLTIGKKNIEEDFRERSHIDQMKADILRRAEAILEEEDKQEYVSANSGVTAASGQNVFNPEDELEEAGIKVKVMGDGEESDESDAEAEVEERETGPETIIELAWMRDPKLFNRDAATRRSKAREQLRKDTGWADEQIEGWKIMLDRDPKAQEKVKQKHGFRGNPPLIMTSSGSGPSHSVKGSGRGRGRGRGRGGGGGNRGGGGGSTPGSSGATQTTQERSFKDKHKASRANHNRKRGHDKKMARGMPPSS